MTPEYTPDTIAMILRCLRVQTEGPGPICPVCVHQAGLVTYDEQSGNRITDAGRLVIAIAAERDELRTALEREKRLHSLLLELTRLDTEVSLWGSDFDNAKEQGAGDEELERLIDKISKAVDAANAARAAYVAAGGVVLWRTN